MTEGEDAMFISNETESPQVPSYVYSNPEPVDYDEMSIPDETELPFSDV